MKSGKAKTSLTSSQLFALREKLRLLHIDISYLNTHAVQQQLNHSLIHEYDGCNHYNINCPESSCHKCIFGRVVTVEKSNFNSEITLNTCLQRDIQHQFLGSGNLQDDLKLNELLEYFYKYNLEFDKFKKDVILFCKMMKDAKNK